MADAKLIQSEFRRYADLITPLLGELAPLHVEQESSARLLVERGQVLVGAVIGNDQGIDLIDRMLLLGADNAAARVQVGDNSGARRPVYRGLLVYACLAAYAIRFEQLSRGDFGRWDQGLRPWCDALENELGNLPLTEGHLPAARGAEVVDIAFKSLALHLAGKIFVRDAWTDLAGDVFGKIARAQLPDGSLLKVDGRDHPESIWYHELCLLHALASYAVRAGDRHAAAVVQRASEFHLNETQPDNATHQPWGLFAFTWNRPSQSLADQLLHTTTTALTRQRDGVSLILLADALYCLKLFF